MINGNIAINAKNGFATIEIICLYLQVNL